MISRDRSPVLPASVVVSFRPKRCTGTGAIPETWATTVPITDITFPGGSPGPGHTGSKVFHDSAPALFAGGGTTPTNETELKALAKRIATGYYTWRQNGIDRAYNGVVKPAQDGNLDSVEWTYNADEASTRAISGDWTDEPEELHHVGTDCDDTNCVEMYTPTIDTVTGNRVIHKYRLCLENGSLVQHANGTDTITGCCGGGGTGVMIGCACATPPSTLYMHVTGTVCANGLLNDCTITYRTTPGDLGPLHLGSSSYLSTDTFPDPQTGDLFYYYLGCFSSIIRISRVFPTSIYGSPFLDSVIYFWTIGLPGNTCTPFNLSNGQIFFGGDPSCNVTINTTP